jgi:hypothetical protein
VRCCNASSPNPNLNRQAGKLGPSCCITGCDPWAPVAERPVALPPIFGLGDAPCSKNPVYKIRERLHCGGMQTAG